MRIGVVPGAAMGVGEALGLLLVALLLMPGAGAEHCRQGEYLHQGRCCQLCPAGTYVAEHCSLPQQSGECVRCKEGETYTSHENGLEGCLPCRQCKDDQVTLTPCTLTHDVECQCKYGYFCPPEGCEMCQRCSTTCPEGKKIVQKCNATMDLRCDLPDEGSAALWIIVPLLVGAIFLLLLFFGIRKLMCNKAASPKKYPEKSLGSEGSTEDLILSEVVTPANNTAAPGGENSDETPESQAQANVNLEGENTSTEENSVEVPEQGTTLCEVWRRCKERCCRWITVPPPLEKTWQNSASHQIAQSNVLSGGMPGNPMVREPRCQIIVKDLCQKELNSTFQTFIKEVPPKKWKQLMKKHLCKNDIVEIIRNFPGHREEQSYQMLLAWKNRLGEKKCIIELLDELRSLDTRAYGNILDTLKSNNIISKLEATD